MSGSGTIYTEADLPRLIQWKIRHWRAHPEYEDMLGEAYLHGWRSYLRGVEQGTASPVAWGCRGAAYGPLTWLQKWYGRPGRDRRAAVEFVPLEEADGAMASTRVPETAGGQGERLANYSGPRCKAGHPLTARNTVTYRRKGREHQRCRFCFNQEQKRRRARYREEGRCEKQGV